MILFNKIIGLLTKTESRRNQGGEKGSNEGDSSKTGDSDSISKKCTKDGEEGAVHYQLNSRRQAEEENGGTYFQLSRSWADDFYTSIVTSRNRWRAMNLYILLPGIFFLLVLMGFLIPTQHLEPLLINHYDNGLVTVEPVNSIHAPKNRAEIESDIVRYVVNRESYSAAAYQEQYSLVNLLSENSVSDEYVKAQSSQNKNSPINTLGDTGYRSVQVLNVLFLDKVDENSIKHHNLAQVNFMIINHDKVTGNTKSIPATAIISWEYRSKPKNPEEAWENWNGFVVTHYEIQQQSVSNE